MTTEKTTDSAASALSAGLERRVTELADWFSDNPNTDDIADAIRVLVRDVAFAEREACAKVCEAHTVDDVLVGVGIAKSCADMIRGRSNVELERKRDTR